MPVRCYLSYPFTGAQIDEDEFIMQMEPGNSQTMYFEFWTERCNELPECEVYVVIDPDNEVEEYDEGNNIMSRVITFGE